MSDSVFKATTLVRVWDRHRIKYNARRAAVAGLSNTTVGPKHEVEVSKIFDGLLRILSFVVLGLDCWKVGYNVDVVAEEPPRLDFGCEA